MISEQVTSSEWLSMEQNPVLLEAVQTDLATWPDNGCMQWLNIII